MHEMSLAESILGIVETTARAEPCKAVSMVRLEIGQLSHVDPHAIRFCFDAVTRGTLAEGAKLEIDRAPGRAWCHNCGGEVAVAALIDPCPQCGGFLLQVTGGEDMRVKEIEVI